MLSIKNNSDSYESLLFFIRRFSLESSYKVLNCFDERWTSSDNDCCDNGIFECLLCGFEAAAISGYLGLHYKESAVHDDKRNDHEREGLELFQH